MTSQIKRIAVCAAALGLTAATHELAAAALHPALAALVAAVQAAAGLCTALLVPGLVYLPLCRKANMLREQSQPFYYLLCSVLISVAGHALMQKLALLAGLDASFWSMLGGAALLTFWGALLSARWGSPIQLRASEPMVLRVSVAGAAAVVIFSVAATPPRLVDEAHYMSEQLYQVAPRLKYGPAPRQVTATPGPTWGRRGELLVLEQQRSATVKLTNAGKQAATFPLKWLVTNLTSGDLTLRVWLDDRLVGGKELVPYDKGDLEISGLTAADSVRLPARFDNRRDPRNRPTPVVLLAPSLTLSPGPHTLRVDVSPAPPGPRTGPVTVVDLSGLDGPGFYRALTRHVFIGDTGDIQETLDLSRNFRWHALQHSSSFDGGVFDGGGATSVSDEPPGHHFMCFLAMTFIRDSITSISLLWLVWLALLLWVAVLLSTEDNPTTRWWHLLPLLTVTLIYTRLCRLGLESNAPDTLYLLCWLCVLKVFFDHREKLGLLLAAVAFLVHVTTPQCLVMFGAAYLLVARRGTGPWFTIKACAVLSILLAARVGIIALDAGIDGALYSGQNDFLASNRLSAVKAIILTGDTTRLPDMALKAAAFFPWAMAATCGVLLVIPLTMALPKDVRPKIMHHRGWTMFLFGLFYFVALSLVDVLRSHHLGPIAFPAMAGAARCLSQLRDERYQKALVATMVTIGALFLGYLLLATPDYSGTFSDWYIGLWTLRAP